MQKIKRLTTLVVLVMFLASWVDASAKSNYSYPEPLSLNLSSNEVEVEINQTVDPIQFVTSGYYDEIHYPIIDTTKPQVQYAIYKVEKNFSSLTKVIKVTVKDKVSPTFETKQDKIELQYQQEIDLNDYFSGTDNYSEVTLTFEGTYDVNTAGSYDMVAILKDESNNEAKVNFVIEVAPEEKVETVETIETPTSGSAATDTDSAEGFNTRLTMYGVDCYGCNLYGGVGYTANGIAMTTSSVRQPDGSWQSGITYNGRYIFGASRAHPFCELVTVYNHGYSGSGISPDTPIYGVVADRGNLADNHLDLFVGSEHNRLVSIYSSAVQPYTIITGFGINTGSGCDF